MPAPSKPQKPVREKIELKQKNLTLLGYDILLKESLFNGNIYTTAYLICMPPWVQFTEHTLGRDSLSEKTLEKALRKKLAYLGWKPKPPKVEKATDPTPAPTEAAPPSAA